MAQSVTASAPISFRSLADAPISTTGRPYLALMRSSLARRFAIQLLDEVVNPSFPSPAPTIQTGTDVDPPSLL